MRSDLDPADGEGLKTPKPPRSILEGLYAFPPSRETLGGTSYLIVENTGNILVDCPALAESHLAFLLEKGVRWLFLTHRGGHGKRIDHLQSLIECEILLQEQEAYLLPDTKLTVFQREVRLSDRADAFWTAGHSPGSSCLYWNRHGGVLFTGRHLLPDSQGQPVPLHTAKTFHWPRQLRAVEEILDRYTPRTLHYLCPGAHTGFLRGKGLIDHAYPQLQSLDLESLRGLPPLA
jgi:glyoxylase-like metal-dependent hydrolase (beta-lactamase superfamily II)